MKKVLVLGGTRFFGIHLVRSLIDLGYEVTIATRGNMKVEFDMNVKRIIFNRYDEMSIKKTLCHEHYDIVYDNIAYSSDDIEILLANIKCKKYIVTSSTAVYDPLRGEVRESDFDPSNLVYKREVRNNKMYAHGKRLVEAATKTKFYDIEVIMVRFPYVIGKDDYTKRLYTYIDSFYHHRAMYINNLNSKMSFIRSDEAGRFLAFLSTVPYVGPINAASDGRIAIYDIFKLVHMLSNAESDLDACIHKLYNSDNYDSAPYNGTEDYQINTDLAKSFGFEFSNINQWVEDLVYDILIEIR